MTTPPDLSQLDPEEQLRRNALGMRASVIPQQSTSAVGPVIAPPSVSQGVNLPPVGPSKLQSDEGELSRLKNSPRFLGSQSGIASLKPKSTIGKVGKGILGGLDVIGSTLAPGLAMRIPGTSMHHAMLENQAAGNVAGDVGQQEKQAQTNATNTEAETAKQKEAEVERHNRAEEDIQNEPIPDKPVVHATDQGLIMVHPDGTATPLTMNGKPLMEPEKVAPKVPGRDIPFPPDVERQKEEGQNRVFAHQEKMAEQRMAQQEKAQAAKDNQLTSTTRSMVEAAPKVLQLASRINALIDQQAKALGPASSRWAEFMAGKVGAPNPQFTQLRTDVGLLTTLLMRMHVGARGGEYIMKHFQDLIDSGKQSPENLKAALGEIVTYANDVAAEGNGGGGPQPQPGTIEGGYRFKGGDPSKQENWEKAQ